MQCRAEAEERKAERCSSSAAERSASASAVHTTGRSERLVEELKARRFRQIFTYLDQVHLTTPAKCPKDSVIYTQRTMLQYISLPLGMHCPVAQQDFDL